MAIISVLIGVLIIVVAGAICFWAIDKFAPDGRLANLLKLLVVLVWRDCTTPAHPNLLARAAAAGPTKKPNARKKITFGEMRASGASRVIVHWATINAATRSR
jgi:multisubunit Na+/H+ antiporter MnhG subunit